MSEERSGTTSPPRPAFGYVTNIDPALSTFGWKIVGLAHLAMLLPLLGAFFPRDASTRWPYVIAVNIVGLAIITANLVWFIRMVRSGGYRSPPPLWVLAEVVVVTITAATLSYAIGGTTGTYRPLVFVPLLLIAMIGDRWMIVVTWLTAVVSVATAAVASGAIDHGVTAFIFSYGVVWGIAAIMVHLLALSALHSDHQVFGLAEVAGIAAEANSLVEGTDRLLPVMADWAGAARAGAYRVFIDDAGSGSLEPLSQWPPDTIVQQPTTETLADAHANRGVVLTDSGALLVAESDDGEALAIVLEALTQPSYDRLMTQFNLERMVLQVGVLVNRSRYVARLEDLGRTDGLTGLPNRRALEDQLEQAHAAARRRCEPLSVVMIDLDYFKTFNDSFGHLAGDDLLRNYATRLRARLRSADFVARYGGEEFCAVLPATDAEGAERVIAELHDAFRRADDVCDMTFSAGVAVWDGVESIDDLIGRADRALYVAKAAGRDRTIVHTSETHAPG
ncbi:MAG TPA: GGDEF domain-containing protein [Acidimicrobiales bacterium]|nr:GGDEF domain-containing protein [Acidimicrobiales bacterium]